MSTHGGPVSWVLGGFFNRNEYQSDYAEILPNHPWCDPDSNPDCLEYVSFVSSEVKEKAVFGEATLQIIPQWQVTAGARYFDYTSEIAGAAALPFLGDPLSPYDLTAAGGMGGERTLAVLGGSGRIGRQCAGGHTHPRAEILHRRIHGGRRFHELRRREQCGGLQLHRHCRKPHGVGWKPFGGGGGGIDTASAIRRGGAARLHRKWESVGSVGIGEGGGTHCGHYWYAVLRR